MVPKNNFYWYLWYHNLIAFCINHAKKNFCIYDTKYFYFSDIYDNEIEWPSVSMRPKIIFSDIHDTETWRPPVSRIQKLTECCYK